MLAAGYGVSGMYARGTIVGGTLHASRVWLQALMSRTPRAEAIDSAWRQFGPGPGPLSAPDGGPLSRTVKLVVLPLVLRPSRHRELAATVLDDRGSALVDQLMAEHRHQLRAAAAWFVVLVQHLAARPQDEVSRDSCYPQGFRAGCAARRP